MRYLIFSVKYFVLLKVVYVILYYVVIYILYYIYIVLYIIYYLIVFIFFDNLNEIQEIYNMYIYFCLDIVYQNEVICDG